MNPALLEMLKKSKEPLVAVLLAGGVWLAGRVDLAVAAVDAKLARIEGRIAAVERALNLPLAKE